MVWGKVWGMVWERIEGLVWGLISRNGLGLGQRMVWGMVWVYIGSGNGLGVVRRLVQEIIWRIFWFGGDSSFCTDFEMKYYSKI